MAVFDPRDIATQQSRTFSMSPCESSFDSRNSFNRFPMHAPSVVTDTDLPLSTISATTSIPNWWPALTKSFIIRCSRCTPAPETILPPHASYTRYVHIYGCHYVHLRQTCAAASPAEETVSRAISRIGGVARYVRGAIERGKRNLSLVTIVKLAKALKVKPGELFGESARSSTNSQTIQTIGIETISCVGS